MSARLEAELAELRTRYGVDAGDLCADEIAALVHACERVESPFSATNLALLERPVEVCEGVALWPPTAGAQIWLDEFAAKWWPEGTMAYRWAQVYALMHAREPEAFSRLTERRAARRAVVLSAMRLCCHRRALLRAVSACYGVDEWEAPRRPSKRREEAAQADFAKLVARLEVESGIPRETWLWGRTFMETLRAYAEMHALAALGAGGSAARERALDELDEAVSNLARVKKAIWERHGLGAKAKPARAAEGGAE